MKAFDEEVTVCGQGCFYGLDQFCTGNLLAADIDITLTEVKFTQMILDIAGLVVSEDKMLGPHTFYGSVTDDTHEVVGLLALFVFLAASLGSVVVANATLRPIADSVQRQKRFVSNAAHELRNPLASLQVTLESYLRSDQKSPKLSRAVTEDLLAEVRRLITTSESLLAFESHEADRIKTDCIVAERLALVQERLAAAQAEKNIALHKNISEIPLRVVAADLDTILYNLLHNAIKFSTAGAIVTVTWDGQELEIKDIGPGIAATHLPHIFERFYKADQARSFNGNSNGLGLALVHEIVTKNGGNIAVESTVGKGASFKIRFTQ